MFHTEAAWEESFGSEVLRSLLSQPGLRRYSLVELSTNVRIFHVDILFSGEGKDLELWNRFICANQVTLVELIEQNEFSDITISVQTPRAGGEQYSIVLVTEIAEVLDVFGDKFYLFKCADGSMFSSDWVSDIPKSCSGKKTIYSASSGIAER